MTILPSSLPSTQPGQAAVGLAPRLVAYFVDCGLLFGLFALTQMLVFTPVRQAVGIDEEWLRSGVQIELYTLLTISLPIWLYFILMEKSPWQATLGKRFLGLQVQDATSQQRLGIGQAVARTGIKLLPWEIAHAVNNLPEPLWYKPEPEFRWGFVLVWLLIGGYLVCLLRAEQHQAPHDIVAHTVVVRTGD